MADGGLKRHARGLSREVQVRTNAVTRMSFHGAPPTAQPANANQAVVADLPNVISRANELGRALFKWVFFDRTA